MNDIITPHEFQQTELAPIGMVSALVITCTDKDGNRITRRITARTFKELKEAFSAQFTEAVRTMLIERE
jgi:hypothetical protein